MGYIVTEAAFREFGKHGSRVPIAVTALALRYHLVFCLMAGYAGQFAVLEFAGREEIVSYLMAGSTIF